MIKKDALIKEFSKKKRAYIKSHLNNDNVYSYLTPLQQDLIQKYYEQYTVILFQRMRGSLRLAVSETKAKKLAALKGAGEWDFAGVVDMKVKGAETCELGHPLRYCYYAKNTQNNNTLIFGSTCVGDFFDLSGDDVKALTNIKDVMLKEIKEMVAIKENNWFDEYTLLDADIIGRIWKYMGSDALGRLYDIPMKNVMLNLIKSGLPIPKTLLTEILKDKINIEKGITEHLMFEDSTIINDIYNCGIPFIRGCYYTGFQDIVSKVKNPNFVETTPNIKQLYKYYGFSTKENLNNSMKQWLNRADRLIKALNYFKKIDIITPWKDIFSEVMRDKEVDKDIYLGVNLLTVFDLQGEVSRTYGDRGVFYYRCNNTDLQLEVLENFDTLLDKLAKKVTIDYIRGIENKITELKLAEKLKQDKETQIIDYIKENIDKIKYEKIWGKDAIKDILINKGLTFERMTEKQGKFVERYYTEMQGVDLQEKQRSKVLSDENKVYLLKDKPEVIAKMQRLQNEADDKAPQKTKDIISSILRYQKVSDRQLRHINDAYLEYVLGEKSVRSTAKPESQSTISENRKYKLSDRPDIKSKIEEVQRSNGYDVLPQKTKDILGSVLKYNSVSDKQLVYVNDAYEKVCK